MASSKKNETKQLNEKDTASQVDSQEMRADIDEGQTVSQSGQTKTQEQRTGRFQEDRNR